jgi:hypothetical protein
LKLGDQPLLYCYWRKEFAESFLDRTFTDEEWAEFCDEYQDAFVEGANEAMCESIAAEDSEIVSAATPTKG